MPETEAPMECGRLIRALFGLLASSTSIGPHAQGPESMAAMLYEVTTETVMPHVEENLRYATTREQRCLSEQDLVSEFSILSHVSLKGCKLEHETRVNDSLTYLLTCDGGHGTTGTAQWLLGSRPIRGTLDVRLGGKNMTLTQRVTATPLGGCASR